MKNTGPLRIISIFTLFLITFQCQSQSKRFLKKIRGDWQLDGLILYGDTVFNLSTMDSNEFVSGFIKKNKALRKIKTLSEKDSMMMVGMIKKRLDNLTSTRLIFEKDSVYKSLAQDNKNNSFGKYWAENDHSIYIRDSRSGAEQKWKIEPGKEYLRMENEEERTVFILKRN